MRLTMRTPYTVWDVRGHGHTNPSEHLITSKSAFNQQQKKHTVHILTFADRGPVP